MAITTVAVRGGAPEFKAAKGLFSCQVQKPFLPTPLCVGPAGSTDPRLEGHKSIWALSNCETEGGNGFISFP